MGRQEKSRDITALSNAAAITAQLTIRIISPVLIGWTITYVAKDRPSYWFQIETYLLHNETINDGVFGMVANSSTLD